MGLFYGLLSSGNMDVQTRITMVLAFLLVVMVDGVLSSTPDMLFQSVYECNKYASAIETGEVGPDKRTYKWQENIVAYCVPKMVDNNTLLFK